jgi:serine/threonine protein kinase
MKPENILIDEDLTVKIADLAFIADINKSPLTKYIAT